MANPQNWRPFEEARQFVRKLKLNSGKEWKIWIQNPKKPKDIPSTPQKVYRNKGWTSWGDWLGNGVVAFKLRQYRSFKEARSFIRSLKFKNYEEFKKWTQSGEKPEDISTTPYLTYKNKGWVNWSDFLGTENINTKTIQFRSFQEARTFARSLKIAGKAEWEDWAIGKVNIPGVPPRPKDIPKSPSKYYKEEGWLSWIDWLDTSTEWISKETYCSFEEARDFVQRLGLQSREDWKAWVKGNFHAFQVPEKPKNIPKNPEYVYEDRGWINWGDWLGTYRSQYHPYKDFRSFEEARQFVHTVGLKSHKEWRIWARSEARPKSIPSNPPQAYKREKKWKGWGDWLGTGNVASSVRRYRPFKEARVFARQLRIQSVKAWYQWAKTKEKPEDIPASPPRIYKESGWVSWLDWLGHN